MLIVGSFASYLMLGMVTQEDGDLYYDFFPIPNSLTLFRFIITPLIAATIIDRSSENTNAWLVFTLLMAAAISDTLDGNVARIFNLKSNFGRVWDPAVDVFFHSVIAGALFVRNIIPWWFMTIVMLRYILPLIAGPIFYLFHTGFRVKATWPGKLSSFMMSCFMGFFFVGVLFHWDELVRFTLDVFSWIVVAVNAFTLGYFLIRGSMVVKEEKNS